MHTRLDHFFCKSLAIPYIAWVSCYSLVFLGIIGIEEPPYFINIIYYIQIIVVTLLIPLWYSLCYSKFASSAIDRWIKKNPGKHQN